MKMPSSVLSPFLLRGERRKKHAPRNLRKKNALIREAVRRACRPAFASNLHDCGSENFFSLSVAAAAIARYPRVPVDL